MFTVCSGLPSTSAVTDVLKTQNRSMDVASLKLDRLLVATSTEQSRKKSMQVEGGIGLQL